MFNAKYIQYLKIGESVSLSRQPCARRSGISTLPHELCGFHKPQTRTLIYRHFSRYNLSGAMVEILTWNFARCSSHTKVICVLSHSKQSIHHINHIKRRVNGPLKIDAQSTWSKYPNCWTNIKMQGFNILGIAVIVDPPPVSCSLCKSYVQKTWNENPTVGKTWEFSCLYEGWMVPPKTSIITKPCVYPNNDNIIYLYFFYMLENVWCIWLLLIFSV